ncbi:hypothetical protein SAMN04487857_102144 [Pseudomonas sp. ok272]|uniref:hypothetical protein n=1 Tax=unclassified Pseudomonas TaxID=196821 RepID=UPI0008C2AD7A|nr:MULTISPECIES: hypothetical protein [unclassified Pseudomonas]SEM46920.1 hypothetical protein SAMN04487857_102144 [Pseudomonas sp. ok272]SFM18526.1 hypothetical protein SAMN04487858_101145 [Pseudomonas sp. ok602]
MPLNKPEQHLRADLKDIASELRWSAVEMKSIAERLKQSGNPVDAESLLRMCEVFERTEARLNSYADEVKAHKINLSSQLGTV